MNKQIFNKYQEDYEDREEKILHLIESLDIKRMKSYQYITMISLFQALPDKLLKTLQEHLFNIKALDINKQMIEVIRFVNERLNYYEQKEDN